MNGEENLNQPLPPLEISPENADSTPAIDTPMTSETPEAPETPEIILSLEQQIARLQAQEQSLKDSIAQLQTSYTEQLQTTQQSLQKVIQESLLELEQKKQTLQVTVEQLERRRDRIKEEMRKNFAGVSQDLAIRVQGFKDYLVGSLQDLAMAAEQLELSTKPPEPEKLPSVKAAPVQAVAGDDRAPIPNFAEQSFQDQAKQIRSLLDKYRKTPDYYGAPWQLRRTFEPVHAERVSNWLFAQGGRGALRTMGSRLQNILVASAGVSVLHNIYGDRLRTLVLANSPERLGEWRRGLQDCLGISRSDFGPDRGAILFEEPAALIQKADRLVERRQLPLIIIDETEAEINLALLQFPLWLAFAANPQQQNNNLDY
jgi:hypothetical protein